MNAHKSLRVEERFQLGEALLLEVRLPFGFECNVVVLRFDVVELLHCNDVHLRAVSYKETLERNVLRSRGSHDVAEWHGLPACDFLSGKRERLVKPLLAEWLEQVVHCMHLKGFHRVLVVSRHEDHRRVLLHQFQDLEPVQLRHLHVEEEEIRLELRDGLDGFETVGAFGNDFDIRVRREVLSHDAAREILVINDNGAELLHWFSKIRKRG